MLEHGIDVTFVRCHARHIDTLETDGALGRILETRDHPQSRRLTASGRTEHREELAGTDREVGVRYRDVVVEPLCDVVNFDDRSAATPVLVTHRRGLRVGGASLGQDPSSVVGVRNGRAVNLYGFTRHSQPLGTYMCAPPSMRTSVPVTKNASSLPSIATTAATASGLANIAPSGSLRPGATRWNRR